MKTKVGVLGIGAIGTVISSLLIHNDKLELNLYNRSPRHFLKIKQTNKDIAIPVIISTSINAAIDLDWLIICLKEHQYADAKTWLQHLINTNTRVVIIRNGLRLSAPLLAYSNKDQIIECMIDCPTQSIGDGVYKQYSPAKISLSSSRYTNSFIQLFNEAEIEFKVVKDFKSAAWKKLIESAALGAILCLTGETCWIFNDEKMKLLHQKIVAEAIHVAKADGANIPDNLGQLLLQKLTQYPDAKGSSMLSDRLNGNPIELGAKNGIISKLGKAYDVQTPINDLLCLLMSKINVR